MLTPKEVPMLSASLVGLVPQSMKPLPGACVGERPVEIRHDTRAIAKVVDALADEAGGAPCVGDHRPLFDHVGPSFVITSAEGV